MQKRQKGVVVAVCSEDHDRSEKRTDRGGNKPQSERRREKIEYQLNNLEKSNPKERKKVGEEEEKRKKEERRERETPVKGRLVNKHKDQVMRCTVQTSW